VFSEALSASRELLQPGGAVLLDVEAEADGEVVKVRAQRISSLEAVAEARHTGIKIYLEGTRALDTIAEQVEGRKGQGELILVLRLDDAGREVEFVLPQGIDATPKQRSALKLVQGVAAVSAL
jgi:DNA polymerase-3 subunit alpha